MKKALFFFLATFSFVNFVPSAHGEKAGKIPKIGLLVATTPLSSKARTEALRHGLRELGYVEGKNIVIEFLYARGNFDRLPTLAAQLVNLNVDIIVTLGGVDTRAAKKATNVVPIVMTQDPDPVGSGFVASLGKPGGNITGLSRFTPEMSGKRLELLREIVPKLSRVAVFGVSSNPINARALREVRLAAKNYGLRVQYIDVPGFKDVEIGFRTAKKGGAGAVLVLPGPIFQTARKRIVGLAEKNKLPTVYDRREFVDAGGLVSYGANIPELAKRAAVYVDRILKGAKPADLPIERPVKFDLAINLKAAKAIGISMPPEVLYRADKVIK